YLTTLFDLPFSLLFLFLIGYLGGSLILVPFCMLSLFGLIYLASKKWITSAVTHSARAYSEKQNFQLSTIDHLRNIKIQGMEKTWSERYKDLTAKATYQEFKASMYTATMNTLSDLIMMLSGLMVITIGVVKTIDGNMTVGALIACMMLVWRALSPIKVFFSILPKLNQISNSVKQINNLMKLKSEKSPHDTIKPFPQKEGNILF